MNLIDGVNGLVAATTLSSLAALAFMANREVDTDFLSLIFFFFSFYLIFFVFNYPWGKIFMGDLGAYFSGFTIGGLTIIFYSRHPELPTWGAVLLLFYPSFEVLFSIIRRFLKNKHPFQPDKNHLHTKLFYLVEHTNMRPLVSNAMILPFLTSLWISPSFFIPWIYKSPVLILVAVFIMIALYTSLFYFYLISQMTTRSKLLLKVSFI